MKFLKHLLPVIVVILILRNQAGLSSTILFLNCASLACQPESGLLLVSTFSCSWFFSSLVIFTDLEGIPFFPGEAIIARLLSWYQILGKHPSPLKCGIDVLLLRRLVMQVIWHAPFRHYVHSSVFVIYLRARLLSLLTAKVFLLLPLGLLRCFVMHSPDSGSLNHRHILLNLPRGRGIHVRP